MKKFADNGWKVAGFYKNNAGPEVKNVTYYQMDVADWRSIQKAFDAAFCGNEKDRLLGELCGGCYPKPFWK